MAAASPDRTTLVLANHRVLFSYRLGWSTPAGGGATKALWRHRVDGDATDVAATAQRVYLVGHYDYVLGKNTTCGAPPAPAGTTATS